MIDVESAEVAPGEIVGGEQFDPRAELFERRRHFVADAHHVADRSGRPHLDVQHLDGHLRRPQHVPSRRVRILDDLVALRRSLSAPVRNSRA